MQAATIAAKDVSALRKASGSNRCKKMNKNGAFKLVALAARRAASRKDGSAAATPSTRPRATTTHTITQAPA